MATITLQANLMEDLRSLAAQQNIAPEEVVAVALRRYMRQAQEQKIREEVQAFRSIHSELVKRYLGQVEVVGDEYGNEIILGRNVLNRLRLLLDGPSAVTEVTE